MTNSVLTPVSTTFVVAKSTFSPETECACEHPFAPRFQRDVVKNVLWTLQGLDSTRGSERRVHDRRYPDSITPPSTTRSRLRRAPQTVPRFVGLCTAFFYYARKSCVIQASLVSNSFLCFALFRFLARCIGAFFLRESNSTWFARKGAHRRLIIVLASHARG